MHCITNLRRGQVRLVTGRNGRRLDLNFCRLDARHDGGLGSVDEDVAEVVEQLLSAVLRRLQVEKLRILSSKRKRAALYKCKKL
jgi:hypothetical protein